MQQRIRQYYSSPHSGTSHRPQVCGTSVLDLLAVSGPSLKVQRWLDMGSLLLGAGCKLAAAVSVWGVCVCVCVCACACVYVCDEMSFSLHLCKRSGLLRDGAS